MGRTRVTLADVAAASGVSITTASLVLTGRARELRISEAAERRVRSTAQELGYRRNTLATGPRPARAQTIGLVSDTIASSGLAGDMVKGAVEAAYRRGYMLFVGESGGDPLVERALIDAMHDRHADGVVFAAMYTRVVALPEGLYDGPAVLLNATSATRTTIPSVVPDEVEAGRSAAGVLVEAGHDRGIHLIGAGPGVHDVPPNSIAAAQRLLGLREVFGAAGIEVVSAHRCPKWTPEHGYEATAQLLRTQRPKALVCFNDRLAFGAYQALGEAGLAVPGDVSVVGFDDHPVASWMRPRLTTIALPHHELGARAVAVLVDMLERRGRDVRPPMTYRVPMPVREGGSVARPRR
ncbi:LacI family DNA-binding transcriptional regulator [Lentzea sp. BCCO 10_0856]|uniref:LacI family DNA-binding transcriptional regulator n=1 Tax=Lentzea miocenica TaxID=3095431 RepID=A0ABU4T3H9_9PSEU|nr:LacI family DNA-binding transcriptional regulator [Lentzea sp. BCCO 10_0856]MDX8032718.1 LacI family DNA-binding transcriptional regulator [Lentzea sp. BCCO 10_0856]